MTRTSTVNKKLENYESMAIYEKKPSTVLQDKSTVGKNFKLFKSSCPKSSWIDLYSILLHSITQLLLMKSLDHSAEDNLLITVSPDTMFLFNPFDPRKLDIDTNSQQKQRKQEIVRQNPKG